MGSVPNCQKEIPACHAMSGLSVNLNHLKKLPCGGLSGLNNNFCVKISKRSQTFKKMSNVKKSNSYTRQEIHKKKLHNKVNK